MNKIFSQRLSYSADFRNLGFLIIVWLLMVILVNPIGDFPLNDDWAYGWSVKNLLETGRFELSDWSAANLLPQVLWGTLFCLPFGFSFTALRFSTLILGLIGVVVTYGLLRETKATSKLALVGSLLIALNPIYFGLSNSFNTDIPSFTIFILSFYFLVIGARLNSRLYSLLGFGFAFISILNRQSSLVILPAFGIAYLYHQGFSIKNSVKAFFPTLLGILVYSAYSFWLSTTERTPLLYGFQIEKLKETLFSGLRETVITYFENFWLFLAYLSLFLFPVLAFQFFSLQHLYSVKQKRFSYCCVLLLITIGLTLILNREQMPLIGNILRELGLGPISLGGYDSFLKRNNYLRFLVRGSWALITLVSFAGISILLQYYFLAVRSTKYRDKTNQNHLIVFLISTSILYFLPIGGINKAYWFDRYLILLLPLALATILTVSIQFSKNQIFSAKSAAFFCATLSLVSIFTVSATRDYLTWNRVRWQALDNLIEQSQVSPEQIGGGFEFNGWFFGNRIETCNPEFQRNGENLSANWHDFVCLGQTEREYLVSFSSEPGYEPQITYSFRRWLPPREEVLYILQKRE